jgi:hypothetical protein
MEKVQKRGFIKYNTPSLEHFKKTKVIDGNKLKRAGVGLMKICR